jgi:hypothetical protein
MKAASPPTRPVRFLSKEEMAAASQGYPLVERLADLKRAERDEVILDL